MHVSHYGTDFKLTEGGEDGSLRHGKPRGSPKGTKFLLANSDQKNGRVRCGIKKENRSTSMETGHSGDSAAIHMTSSGATAK